MAPSSALRLEPFFASPATLPRATLQTADLAKPACPDAQAEFARYARKQIPILNKIKQQLSQSYLWYVQQTNEVLLHGWNPETEYQLMLLEENLQLIVSAEDEMDELSNGGHIESSHDPSSKAMEASAMMI